MAQTIKQPVKKSVAKVPVIIQMEALECGAACLAMICAYFEKWIPLSQVRQDCGVSRDGSTLKNVYLAAQSYGLDVHAFLMEPETLKEKATFPCIVHWNFNHFVVVDGFRKDKVVINDPGQGRVQLSMEEFDRSFTGPCMMFAPGPDFEPSGKRRNTFDYARQHLRGSAAAVAFVVLTTIISYLFGAINPVMSRIFFDRLLNGRAPGWVTPFMLVMTLLCVLQVAVEWIHAIYSQRINGKLAIEGSASFFWKLIHLPMHFFSQRMAGDLLGRQKSSESIAASIVRTVGPLVLDTVMMVFYLVIMIRYNVLLTMVGLGSTLLNLLLVRQLSEKKVNMLSVQMRDAANLSSTTLAGISMAETIKASGAEAGFFRKWSGYEAAVNRHNVEFGTLNAQFGTVPQLLTTLSNYAVLFLGVGLAMNDQFTLGMIMSFQGIMSSFMQPAVTLIDAGQSVQEMRGSMERLEDVMEYPEDPFTKEETLREDATYQKLRGQVQMRDVTFGYSPLGSPVLSDFSLSLEPGKSVAIVGMSGCGKSTVSKLLCGLYRPWSGEILIDGKPISQIPRSVFTGSVAMVEQDIVLFEDTIANNIRMWDDTIQDFEVILAARDAQLHADIVARPGGYQNRLTENGKDLSGGQRQRLEIARALAQDPSLIVLDEATSALDANTEYNVVKAIRDRGISCVVVAHRLSTIRDCDEIIVLDAGRVVERGTHDELYANGEVYRELVTHE
ncbi:MAG: NHLP family bacteriocin export ABC transporter peptidase/permease/ATPase subunit [Atopobiaceae bacterium]|nr:NHLP family bacteriocin export ABC transporter peptidase/permease/ATPase subunit [Atopobiaceae bacterium]